MVWKVSFTERAQKDLAALPLAVQRRILHFARDRLQAPAEPRNDPVMRLGVKLQNSGDLWRFRVGDYRIVAQAIRNELLILVVKIGHRREVYNR